MPEAFAFYPLRSNFRSLKTASHDSFPFLPYFFYFLSHGITKKIISCNLIDDDITVLVVLKAFHGDHR